MITALKMESMRKCESFDITKARRMLLLSENIADAMREFIRQDEVMK